MIRLATTLLAATALGLFSGCATSTGRSSSLIQSEQAYAARQYETAIARATTALKEESSAANRARALYFRALAAAQLSRRVTALVDLDQAARLSSDKDLQWRVNALRGTIQYEDGNWSAAIVSLDAAVADMPARPPMDTHLFRLGECYERVGRWAESRAAFARLLDRFPNTSSAAAARKRTTVQARSYAVQCGVFSSSSNAERQATDLRGKGFSTVVRQEPRAGRMQYVVLVGNYSRYEDARSALARVKAFVPTAILWP
jgi:tetratricopeptide (TPR) repeat protein